MKKKILNIFGALSVIIGLITMFVGYQMGQGNFMGKVYFPGDYTTMKIGGVWLALGLLILIFSNIKMPSIKANPTGCLTTAIRFFAILIVVTGIFTTLMVNHSGTYLFWGISIIIGGLLIFGLSYIIEAAILYISKHRNE